MVYKEKYIMAIYPYTNTYVINKDAVAGSSFKAGMVLMMNADGKAVPADSQVLALNSAGQKPESPRCTPSSSKYHNWEKK